MADRGIDITIGAIGVGTACAIIIVIVQDAAYRPFGIATITAGSTPKSASVAGE